MKQSGWLLKPVIVCLTDEFIYGMLRIFSSILGSKDSSEKHFLDFYRLVFEGDSPRHGHAALALSQGKYH